MNQIPVAIKTLLLITLARVDYSPMSKHGTSLSGYKKDVAMTLQTLIILYGKISPFSGFFPAIGIGAFHEVDDYIFGTMQGFCVEEFYDVMRCRQMTVHAVGHKSLAVVNMGGHLPGVVGRLYFMAACAKSGSRCANHGVVSHRKEGKAQDDPEENK